MTVTYSRVGIELWGSKTIGECTPRQVENVRSKRRVSAGRDLVCLQWFWSPPMSTCCWQTTRSGNKLLFLGNFTDVRINILRLVVQFH